MPENRILFHVGTDAWRLAGVCLVLGLVLLAIAVVLGTVLLARYGRRRRLVGREASDVAFNADKIGQARTIVGPAVGAEVRITASIGDLRRARQKGDLLFFWGVPALLFSWCGAFGLSAFGCAVATRDPFLLLFTVFTTPFLLLAGFMPWAAVHTKLE